MRARRVYLDHITYTKLKCRKIHQVNVNGYYIVSTYHNPSTTQPPLPRSKEETHEENAHSMHANSGTQTGTGTGLGYTQHNLLASCNSMKRPNDKRKKALVIHIPYPYPELVTETPDQKLRSKLPKFQELQQTHAPICSSHHTHIPFFRPEADDNTYAVVACRSS